MNPGRELDALVAENVLGYTRSNVYKDENGEPWMLGPKPYGHIPFPARELSKFSTDIAAAWSVLEKLIDRANNDKDFKDKGPWHVKQNLLGGWAVFLGDRGGIIVSCETVPHAICLAALKAVGVELVEA